MDSWKKIQISGIARIEKCVAEFQVWELNNTPYGKFKVKVFERADGTFAGYTNIAIKNHTDNSCEFGVGFGESISAALEDTTRYFLEILKERKALSENDFEWADYTDF